MIKTIKDFKNDHFHFVFGIDDLALATVIGSVVAGVASIVSSAATNKANKDAVESTNEQNRELTERAWERDDMQLQRARQDAEKAGFSPLAALSSNLTNSAPATMQAPSYDYSGIGQGIGEIAKGPALAKQAKTQRELQRAQIAQIHEQSRGVKLDNMLKHSTFRNNVLKNGFETMKLLEEARSQKLSNAQVAAILRANGYSQDQAEKLSGIADVPIDKTTQADILNTKASTSVLNKQESYIEAQKNYTNLQYTINSSEYKEWNADTARLARTMMYNLQKSLGEYESYLNNVRVKTLGERQQFSIPVSVDADGYIVYQDLYCSYAEYLVRWEDFLKRSNTYFNEPTNLERAKVILDSVWTGFNAIKSPVPFMDNFSTTTTKTKKRSSKKETGL